MLVASPCIILILFELIDRTISADRIDLRSNNLSQGFVFPREVLLFTAVPFYSPRASFLLIRHMNRSLCSLNAMGNAVFPCRCFAFPSDHYELLIDNISIVKFSVIIREKSWKIPETPIICQPLVIEFDSNMVCSELNLSLHLQYIPSTISIRKTDNLKFKSEAEMTLKEKVVFPCHHLCFPGIYRIIIMNDGKMAQVIKVIKLQQIDEISISLPRPYIFPRCFDYLKITWTNLSCPIQDLEFKLRVFAVPEGSNFEHSYYMEEYDIELSQQSLELPCYQFDIIHAQFCFEIVSVQKFTARFNEWARRCVYTENLGQVEGGWRDWSAWSSCSVSCGHGLRRRWRLCDSPIPQNGGNLCEGNFVESLDCDVGNCTEFSATAIATSDTSCSCGCLINHVVGRFFARTCKEVTDWTLKSRGRFLHLELKYDSVINEFRFVIYRGLKKEELIYDSGMNNYILKSSLQFISEDYLIISLLKMNSSSNINSGVEISFEWRNASGEIFSSITTLKLSNVCIFCHRNLSFLLLSSLISLFIILVISLPPILCSYATISVIRKAKWKRNQQLRITNSLEEPRPNLSMIQSGQTDTTEIRSNRTVVTKRSIGIQLSASSTPRFPRDKGILWSRTTNSPQMTPRNDDHSSLSFNADHDLEYDYYEPAVPGSFLTPIINFCSDIDIEQIIGCSELSSTFTSKHDAHTQINDNM
uniref:Uncharacterized protein n=1 Tax=Onchocerca volvulus TaxID=6282 RepID=A0A8R1XTV2_ONCVO